MLKDMLLSLRASDLVSSIKQCKAEVQALGDRIDHVEHTMGDYSTSFNTLVDAHNEEMIWLKDKMADLKDRSRGNNTKIRGIPESIPASQLHQFAFHLGTHIVCTGFHI